MVAASVGSEGGGDAVDVGAGLKLSGHDPLAIYPQRLARTDHVQVEHGDGAGEREGGVLHIVPGA